ncbi:MAG: hypothetical protein M1812_006361 [Candelaria pacifica]|nr:MAG: hypothetical protein M1812_006361 [Candelaria pacifica]
MQEVIESSQVDFEESGIDQHTLEELKETWQKKLSNLQVATFPWEPTPAATPIINPPTVPSNVSQQHQPKPSPSPVPSIETAGVRVKTEANSNDDKPAISTIAQGNGGMNPQAAQQRAASLMQGRFGSQASKQVETLQAGLALQGQQRPQGGQASAQNQAQSQSQSYNQYQAQQQQRQAEQRRDQQQQQQADTLNVAQTDGAGDAENEWAGVIMRRNAAGQNEQMGTVHADGMMRRQLEAMSQRLEGGGLLVPLASRPKPAKMNKRKAAAASETSSTLPPVSISNISDMSSRYDGGDESDDDEKLRVKDEEAKYVERDEDAINSDLDDPNAPVSGEEDEDVTQFMLCTYDKVQRVKNKWKCTLKDGVLMVNGREYVITSNLH